MTKRIYYKTKKEAIAAKKERLAARSWDDVHIFKMPKGSRKVGWFAVCSELEYLNLP